MPGWLGIICGMKAVLVILLLGLVAVLPARAQKPNPIYQTTDAQRKLEDAKRHVHALMQDGRHAEASKFMSTTYQVLACEVAEQNAGRSVEESAATCAKRNPPAGLDGKVAAPEQASAESLLGPGISVMQRTLPGSSSFLDNTSPSIFVFDPRTTPGTNRPEPTPWTGTP